jgi:hypothetical protein
MNRTIRTTAAALGVGALLAGGLAVTTAVAAPDDAATTVGSAFGMGNANGRGSGNAYGSGTQAQGKGYGATLQSRATAQTTTPTEASADLAEALIFAREEERMARDLYAAIADLYDGARPFSMITNSEQQHFDAVGALLTRYGVDDPADGADNGVFENATLQDLYDGWWDDAQASLDAAYQVGIELEQRDIADLEDMIAADYPDDVDGVLSRLLQGSRNHLSAYQRAADGTLGAGPQGSQARGTGAGMMNGGVGYDGDCPMADTDD